MYNQCYDDYLRTALGIGTNYDNMYGNCNTNDYYLNNMQSNTYGMSREQLESCMPDIYKIINPLVVRTWNINTKPITIELIEQITEQIYETVDDHREIRMNINLTNEVSKSDDRSKAKEETKEDRAVHEDRNTNYLLKDLIRILTIKDLLGRPNFMPPNRPPMYPPFPGGPMPRPPMPPRDRI